MVLRLQDIRIKGSNAGVVELPFVQNNIHGYGALDKYEYAIGLRRGSLSKPQSGYTLSAPVHESLLGPFEKCYWALLPLPLTSVDQLVKDLRDNMKRPYALLKRQLPCLIHPGPGNMFSYRLVYYPSEMELVDRKGNPCPNGATVLSPVHPFLSLASLLAHATYPSAESLDFFGEVIGPIINWQTIVEFKGFNPKWIQDGWQDVLSERPIPEHIVAEYEPEVDVETAKRDGKTIIYVGKHDPDYPYYRDLRLKEEAQATEKA